MTNQIISQEASCVCSQRIVDPLNPGIKMIWIPQGEFWMGSSIDEPAKNRCEMPQHPVNLDGFFMSETTVTQAQWREVAQWKELKEEKWGMPLNPEPSRFQPSNQKTDTRNYDIGWLSLQPNEITDCRPVESVTWHEAMEFCNRISQRFGKRYSLPTEAQWEYACRAGFSTPFAFGNTLTARQSNHFSHDQSRDFWYEAQTIPVGRRKPNAWGLHDMHGNVWEWCLDHWHENYISAPCDGSGWINTDADIAQSLHVVRGGSWYDDHNDCRSASRCPGEGKLGHGLVGFRVVSLLDH